MRVLVFGDSITQGFWDERGGWTDRLRAYYDTIQINNMDGDEPVIFNLGISADTSEEIQKRIKIETIARTRHNQKPIIILQIGTNDSMIEAGEERVPIKNYQENLQKILELVADVSSKVILVGFPAVDETKTTPVSWGDYIYNNERIQQYERAMQKVAEQHELVFVPIFDEFKKALDDGKDLLADGLHPNSNGHQHVFEVVKQKLDRTLS